MAGVAVSGPTGEMDEAAGRSSGAARKTESFITRGVAGHAAARESTQTSTFVGTGGISGTEGIMKDETAKPTFPVIREAVASFATKAQFRDAVARLLAAGFKPTDLSVLASHDSLEVAGGLPGYPAAPDGSLTAGLTDEVRYLAPLTVAGIALISGGPVAVALAALVGAGLGGAAIKEVLDYYAANKHSAEFAAALEAGAVLLWVRAADPDLEAMAVRLLEEAGGRHVHIHGRAEKPAA